MKVYYEGGKLDGTESPMICISEEAMTWEHYLYFDETYARYVRTGRTRGGLRVYRWCVA